MKTYPLEKSRRICDNTGMFLRATKRVKDGKAHQYWSIVENVRIGRRVFQRRALYLGELNDSQHSEWQHAIEAFDDDGHVQQLKLFPDDRAPESDDSQIVRIRMDRLTVRNMRNWGEIWLGTELWGKLGLDNFWEKRIAPSRKGTDWVAILKAIVIYRLVNPGSELAMHTNWLANSAVSELIGAGALTGLSTLYKANGRSHAPRGVLNFRSRMNCSSICVSGGLDCSAPHATWCCSI